MRARGTGGPAGAAAPPGAPAEDEVHRWNSVLTQFSETNELT